MTYYTLANIDVDLDELAEALKPCLDIDTDGISDLDDKVTDLRADSEDHDGRIDHLERELDDVKSSLERIDPDDITQRLDDLERDDFDDLERRISDIESEESNTDRINDLGEIINRNADSFDERLATFGMDVEGLSKSVKALEERLAAVGALFTAPTWPDLPAPPQDSVLVGGFTLRLLRDRIRSGVNGGPHDAALALETIDQIIGRIS